MPRPPDTYTHGQFTPVESDPRGETVRCNHCKSWTGNIKTLNRKKDHLLRCPAYLAWRAAGHGQDLAPPNTYNKRDSSSLHGDDLLSHSPYPADGAQPAMYSSTVMKSRYYDISKSFDEFFDDSAGQKCMRVRCRYCGFVRAKNTTRQVEHLGTCRDFLSSTEGQQALANGDLVPGQPEPPSKDIWRGGAPNPNLSNRGRAPNKPRTSTGPSANSPAQSNKPKPSLTNFLLMRTTDDVVAATQKPFLSHAGDGTLAAAALNAWLAQIGHISRALISFAGSLIGKTRIPEVADLKSDPTFRAVDLLCSAGSNLKKELEFIEDTKRNYGLDVEMVEPQPATRGIVDLLSSASSAQSALLEGLVALWTIEHCFSLSFQYAATFMSALPPSSTTYTLPAYLNPTPTPQTSGPSNLYPTAQAKSDNQHITALHEAFIQNYTSTNFGRFLAACKSIVDEVANAQTSGNGKAEMLACQRVFKQTLWLWGQMWPEVNAAGQLRADELAEQQGENTNGKNIGREEGRDNHQEQPIEIDDDVDDADADAADADTESPYDGTGLEAIAAHNQTSGPGH